MTSRPASAWPGALGAARAEADLAKDRRATCAAVGPAAQAQAKGWEKAVDATQPARERAMDQQTGRKRP